MLAHKLCAVLKNKYHDYHEVYYISLDKNAFDMYST